MKTLTDCVNQLKRNLQNIADTEMTQSYKGLGISLFETNDSEKAQTFSESLQNINVEGGRPSFNNSYSKKALQAVWNVADILSIALTYTPREWSIGILRGFMDEGINGKKYLACLSES
ncbi:MAG: hypothetical protein NXI01_06300, partial [Gammaproteobacteria bacterium]|nr:hypothetical protein [Gammaproteobacteria bacterium]